MKINSSALALSTDVAGHTNAFSSKVYKTDFRRKNSKKGFPGWLGLFLGIVCAVLIHLGFLLFGGSLLIPHKKDQGTLQQVELLSENDIKEKKEPEIKKEEEIKPEEEKVPDPSEIIKKMEEPAVNNAPALEAVSLSAIEAALNGQGGSGDFSEALSFASGGRIGGTGKGGVLDGNLDNAFSLSEIDQKPRAVFQSPPVYPAGMHGRKSEDVVSVIFIVDPSGRVTNPRVEKSTDAAFENPALDAVKRWKFEPAVKGGKRVACKMRVPIRFQPR